MTLWGFLEFLVTCICSTLLVNFIHCIIFMRLLSYSFLVGVPIGFFSASLNQIARTIEDSSSLQNFANKLNWLDLSAENSMVNVVYDLPFFFYFLKVLILALSCRNLRMLMITSLLGSYDLPY